MKIGEVISTLDSPTHLKVVIQLTPNDEEEWPEVRAGEFVEIRDDRGRIFITRVIKPHVFSPFYSDKRLVQDALYRGDTRILIAGGANIHYRLCEVRVLGVILGNNKVESPSIVPLPGSEAHTSDPQRILRFFGLKEDGLNIGKILPHQNLNITIDPISLFAHMAIVGTTNSGKSYSAAVLAEELHNHDFSVLIIDPHGEYNSLKESINPAISFNVVEYCLPQPYHTTYGVRNPIKIHISDLTAEDLIEVANLQGDQQRNLLYYTLRRLIGKRYTLEKLEESIHEVGRNKKFRKDTIDSVINRIHSLETLGIITNNERESIKMEKLIKSRQITIINLSNNPNIIAQRILVAVTLRKLFRKRMSNRVGRFITIIDEAHRYAPSDESTIAKDIIIRIAREGRKFGVGLVLVSQSPKDLDARVLKLCNTRLILRLDNPSDLNAIKPYIGMLDENIIESIPFFPPGQGILSSSFIRAPLLIKIRERYTKHKAVTGGMITEIPSIEIEASHYESNSAAFKREKTSLESFFFKK